MSGSEVWSLTPDNLQRAIRLSLKEEQITYEELKSLRRSCGCFDLIHHKIMWQWVQFYDPDWTDQI